MFNYFNYYSVESGSGTVYLHRIDAEVLAQLVNITKAKKVIGSWNCQLPPKIEKHLIKHIIIPYYETLNMCTDDYCARVFNLFEVPQTSLGMYSFICLVRPRGAFLAEILLEMKSKMKSNRRKKMLKRLLEL